MLLVLTLVPFFRSCLWRSLRLHQHLPEEVVCVPTVEQVAPSRSQTTTVDLQEEGLSAPLLFITLMTSLFPRLWKGAGLTSPWVGLTSPGVGLASCGAQPASPGAGLAYSGVELTSPKFCDFALFSVAFRWWWISPLPTSPKRCTWVTCAPPSSGRA